MRRLLAFLALAACLACGGPRADEVDARLSVAASLGGSGAGFARALVPRAFSFPADHGPHPEFRTEWWYTTGNLLAASGRRFGFQLTVFREALAPHPEPRTSAWAASQVYLAHFALSDVEGRRFRSFERTSRGALGLAGAQAAPFRAWVETWSAAGPPLPEGAASATPMHLVAQEGSGEDEAAIDLALDEGKPPVLHGDRGLSRKGAEPGQASYYYSLTRMPARGTVRSGGETFPVAGLAWMDREWSTSSLGKDQVGWDWFALQLDDGRELMLYRLRRRDGSAGPASQGTLVLPDGSSRPLPWNAVRLTSSDTWTSPRSGARYPARWRLAIPSLGLALDLRPYLADQELDTSFRYWEGAVGISGTAAGRPISGSGYVELTGYGDQAATGPGAPR